MYGDRGRPDRVLRTLSRRLGAAVAAEQVPALVVDTIGTTLRVPWVALDVQTGAGVERVAQTGSRGTHSIDISNPTT